MTLFVGDSMENSIASGNLSVGDILALGPKFSFKSCLSFTCLIAQVSCTTAIFSLSSTLRSLTLQTYMKLELLEGSSASNHLKFNMLQNCMKLHIKK